MRDRKENLPVALEVPGTARFRVAEWGEQAVAYVELLAGADASPLLEGLPDGKCSCPHWGYVLKGAVHVQYSDGRQETSRAGEMFYWPAGHTVRVDEDTSFVEFSPKQQLKQVYDHIARKISAAK